MISVKSKGLVLIFKRVDERVGFLILSLNKGCCGDNYDLFLSVVFLVLCLLLKPSPFSQMFSLEFKNVLYSISCV